MNPGTIRHNIQARPSLVEMEIESKRPGPALFEAVVRHYGDALYRFVARMAGPSGADDVMQETFLKIHQGLPRFDPAGSLKSYVFAIARNAVRDYWKYEARRRTAPLAIDPADPRQDAPAERIERDERWRALLAAVRELPSEQREVFLLREEADLPFHEIARITGAPLNTVLGRMHYAMESLRAKLHELHRS